MKTLTTEEREQRLYLRKIQRQAEEQRKAEHKQKLAEDNGLVGHPKLDLLYDKAWDHGHASGFYEVEIWFKDLAELIQ